MSYMGFKSAARRQRGWRMETQRRLGRFNAEAQRNAEERKEKELSATLCTAITRFASRLRRFLWINCRAKRLECVELAPAFEPSPASRQRQEAGRTPNASRNPNAVWLRCVFASWRLCVDCPFQDASKNSSRLTTKSTKNARKRAGVERVFTRQVIAPGWPNTCFTLGSLCSLRLNCASQDE
jgi:hypothetical protein